jgi:23S rRNA (cytosine1962-C5)-methyltransferase
MTTIPQQFLNHIKVALHNRESFLQQCASEDTTCYRLFHGAVERWPSVTIDRYGDTLLFQTWRSDLNDDVVGQMADFIEEKLDHRFYILWADRRKRGQVERHWVGDEAPNEMTATELGLTYRVDPVHRGIDPLLFLDFRAGRRHIREQVKGKKLLNLFSYTCGIGVAAAAGGAKLAMNVDFANHALSIGQSNANLNEFEAAQFQTIQDDAMLVLRQFSGLGVKGKAKRRQFTKRSARLFDIVVLDPPRRAKSPFGAVDTVNDYQSLFKPALMCTKPGGKMLVTNNVASVAADQWTDSLKRCAIKAGRSIESIDRIVPDVDFPSMDGQHPLKMAWLSV